MPKRDRVSVLRWGLTSPWIPRIVLWDDGLPLLFRRRVDARACAEEEYSYIRSRPDLRAAPHHWRMPRAVRVRVTVERL